MNADRRVLTPVTASIAAALLVGAATLGGSFAANEPATKGDRFAVMGDSLCDGQAWPNLTTECLAWSKGDTTDASVRFVTLAHSDTEAGVTTLTRVRTIPTH